MSRMVQITRDNCVAECMSALLHYGIGVGCSDDEAYEIDRVIARLRKCNGQYWRLSERDDLLIETAYQYLHARNNNDYDRKELINAQRRGYGGTLVTGSSVDPIQKDYFQALKPGKRTRPADVARIERVAREIVALKRSSVPIWRPVKNEAQCFRQDHKTGITLTDVARKRLSEAYANCSDISGISRKDFIICVERAEDAAKIILASDSPT